MMFMFSAVYQDSSFIQFLLDEIITYRLQGFSNWTTYDKLHLEFNNRTIANTDGWGNKLVTIFARHLDNIIMTNNFSLLYQIRDFGSGQILQPRQFYRSPGFAKIAPWCLVRRDNFSAKVPGLVSADIATNVYSLNRRAVIFKPSCDLIDRYLNHNGLNITLKALNKYIYL